MKQIKLDWHTLAIVYAWHLGAEVDDETAFVALCRLREFVHYSLGVIETGNPPAQDSRKEE